MKIVFLHYLYWVKDELRIGWNRMRSAWAVLLLVSLWGIQAATAQFKLLAIGDSLTEEYRFELIFSAPDSNPSQQNVKNWVQFLNDERSSLFSMGNYSGSPFSYADYRNGGYEYNYGVPGFKAETWEQILNDPGSLLDYSTRDSLTDDLDAVDAVLIFLGGNDLSLNSTDAENDQIRVFIGEIHDWVRENAPANLPIIVATVPDIGATPLERLSDPVAAAAARERVALLNMNIISDLGVRDNTYIARIDRLTDRIFDQVPFHLNGTEFIYEPDPENPPLHLFCKDGFHPGDVGQALIANEILKAINQFADVPIPLFSNREILAGLLDQNPDQPFIDFAGSAGGFTENPDGDGLPNLVEFLLGTSPTSASQGFFFQPDGTASFTPSEEALRFAELTVLQSETLGDDWVAVPQSQMETLPDGTVMLQPSGPELFYRFAATPKP